jgi:hypothetical protein
VDEESSSSKYASKAKNTFEDENFQGCGSIQKHTAKKSFFAAVPWQV